MRIEGSCAGGFEAVREAFAGNFAEHGELGAAVTVLVDGEPVVELWGGWAEGDRNRPWERDTLVNAYSVGKPVVAVLLLQLVEAGEVALDAPVAEYWPDFAAHGKDAVTVRHALSHQAGVPAIRERLTNADLWDFDRMCTALAATEPWWPAGTRHAYHTNTFGHLVGGIVRHVTGELPGVRLGRLAEALDADVHFGLAEADYGRCAEVVIDGRLAGADSPPTIRDLDHRGLDRDARMEQLSYFNPPGYSSLGVVNSPEWRRAQVPSTNGHMTATGVARLYDAIRRGDVLGEELLAEAVRPQSSGYCPILRQDVSLGLGFQPWTPNRPFGRNPGGYGHYGTGGSLGFADPTARVAFGYVMNHVIPRWQSPRNRTLVDALYSCL